MARSGKVKINSEVLEDYTGNDLRVAISMWSARMGPATYNQWQSAYFALIRDFGYIDAAAAEDESPAARQRRIRKM